MTPLLNLPAPGRCHTLYVVFTTSQSDVFLLNSRLARFTAILMRSEGQALSRVETPFIPKLQGQFAEFLDHGSLEHLSIFNPSTCVGFRYGLSAISRTRFFLAV